MDLESFFPAKERFELAMQLNNLLASPGFSAWMEGEPLDIQRLLYTPEGKPRLSILSIAHLSDAERMFFVTILLSEVIAWMRSQSGTSSLRAILYMDEVFGYFPPSANPPSKTPMLTLLKQARAFGLGVVLATQNPVDLDYKGLSNCGTWFLGRLQTERDKLRVLDGLEGASAAAGASFDRAEMEQILSGLGQPRVPDEQRPRGPAGRVSDAVGAVVSARAADARADQPADGRSQSTYDPERCARETARGSSSISQNGCGQRPVLPPEITERFASRRANCRRERRCSTALPCSARRSCILRRRRPASMSGRMCRCCCRSRRGARRNLGRGGRRSEEALELEPQPEADAPVSPHCPASFRGPSATPSWPPRFKDHLYRNASCSCGNAPSLKQTSSPDESEAEFRVRLSQQAREQRDAAGRETAAEVRPKDRRAGRADSQGPDQSRKGEVAGQRKDADRPCSRSGRRFSARCSAAS